jgi:hypothetical protein
VKAHPLAGRAPAIYRGRPALLLVIRIGNLVNGGVISSRSRRRTRQARMGMRRSPRQ